MRTLYMISKLYTLEIQTMASNLMRKYEYDKWKYIFGPQDIRGLRDIDVYFVSDCKERYDYHEIMKELEIVGYKHPRYPESALNEHFDAILKEL